MTTTNPATGTSALGPTYDPTSTATTLATSYTADRQTQITNQTADATAAASALTALGTAMSNFDAAITALSDQKSVLSNTATFSDPSVGTATATSQALPGTYSFYVQQLATAGQISYGGLTNTTAAGSGSLDVTLANGTSFQLDLANADTNMDGTLSAKEIAAAINSAAANASKVTASTLTINGSTTLVLTSNATGAQNAATIDTTHLTNATLKSELDNTANQTQLVTAQDAILWVGAQNTGTKVQQASNTVTIVDNVTMTLTQAQAAGAAPVRLTVGVDDSATATSLQNFVVAYNALQTLLAADLKPGDPVNKVADGAFANDSGVQAMLDHMNASLRTAAGGLTLANYGIAANKDGSLSLDSKRLNAQLALNPQGLDAIFGSAEIGHASGVLGGIDALMNQWTNPATGQITQRQSSVARQQTDLSKRQDDLNQQYNNAYARYLAQFTALQTLQSQMASNSSLLTALFSSSSSSA